MSPSGDVEDAHGRRVDDPAAGPPSARLPGMFDTLSDRLRGVLGNLTGHGRISPEDVDVAMREVRLALLEADVNFRVVKEFVARVKERAVGVEVLNEYIRKWPLEVAAEEAYRKCLDIITSDVGLKTVMSDVLESYGREMFSSRKFRGVFARDEIPELKEGQGCIVNNQNHDEEGEHWLALARGSRSGLLLQYDSFGRKNFLVLGIDDSKDTERDAEQGDEEDQPHDDGRDDVVQQQAEFEPKLVQRREQVIGKERDAGSKARLEELRREVAELDKIISQKPEVDAYYRRGIAHQELGEHQQAIDDFSWIINQVRDAPLVYWARAKSKRALGDIDGAAEDDQIGQSFDRTPDFKK